MKITESQLRRIIREEVEILQGAINETDMSSAAADPRQPNDSHRMLADIGIRSAQFSEKIKTGRKNIEKLSQEINIKKLSEEINSDLLVDIDELLNDIKLELNMYVDSTKKFRHDYKPSY